MQSSVAKPYPILLAVAVTLFLITHGVAHAQVSQTVTLAAGQTGRIAFGTATMTDTAFLKGERKGTTVTIRGDLRSPERLTGRAPAVVLLHGTVGAGPREERWAAELNRLGVAGVHSALPALTRLLTTGSTVAREADSSRFL